MKAFETERLLVRDFAAPDDASFVLRLHNEPSYIRGFRDAGMKTLAQAEEYIRTAHNEFEKKFALVLKETGEPIGILIYTARKEQTATEFSIALLPEFHRKGYFVELFRAFCRYASETLGYETVCAKNKTSNPRAVERLLGIKFQTVIDTPDGDEWNFYTLDLPPRFKNKSR